MRYADVRRPLPDDNRSTFFSDNTPRQGPISKEKMQGLRKQTAADEKLDSARLICQASKAHTVFTR
jgi:hypothetical protein